MKVCDPQSATPATVLKASHIVGCSGFVEGLGLSRARCSGHLG